MLASSCRDPEWFEDVSSFSFEAASLLLPFSSCEFDKEAASDEEFSRLLEPESMRLNLLLPSPPLLPPLLPPPALLPAGAPSPPLKEDPLFVLFPSCRELPVRLPWVEEFSDLRSA